MKNIIWLSPSLAAGALAARLVVFFRKASTDEPPSARGTHGPSRPRAEIERDCSSALLRPSQLTQVTINRSQHPTGEA